MNINYLTYNLKNVKHNKTRKRTFEKWAFSMCEGVRVTRKSGAKVVRGWINLFTAKLTKG